MKSRDDLFALLTEWVTSKPVVRGHVVADAELHLRTDGCGRIAVDLDAADPDAEFRATVANLVARLVQARVRGGEPVELPIDHPDRAFADFATLDELARFLRGDGPAAFYLDDEAGEAADPLWG